MPEAIITTATTATPTDSRVDWSEVDRRMMARALEQAAQGLGQVSPGPLVGCVIVDDQRADCW